MYGGNEGICACGYECRGHEQYEDAIMCQEYHKMLHAMFQRDQENSDIGGKPSPPLPAKQLAQGMLPYSRQTRCMSCEDRLNFTQHICSAESKARDWLDVMKELK